MSKESCIKYVHQILDFYTPFEPNPKLDYEEIFRYIFSKESKLNISDEAREILYRHVIGDESYGSISESMKISISTIGVIVSDTNETIRNCSEVMTYLVSGLNFIPESEIEITSTSHNHILSESMNDGNHPIRFENDLSKLSI